VVVRGTPIDLGTKRNESGRIRKSVNGTLPNAGEGRWVYASEGTTAEEIMAGARALWIFCGVQRSEPAGWSLRCYRQSDAQVF
jgi:hypothetical protein